MPASDTLEFNCPNCQVSLLVPKSQAGVSGPCPHCEASITSPAPISQPLRKKPIPAPVDSRPSTPSRESLPVAPQRTIPSPPPPEDIIDDQSWSDDEEEEKKSSGCWPALFFLLFLTIVAYFILSFLNLVPHWKTIPSKLFPKAHKIEQTPSKPTKAPKGTPPPLIPIKVTPPTDPDPVADSTIPDPFEENKIVDSPRECLKSFLSAASLEQRRSLMTTVSLSDDVLRKTILAGPFPESHPPQVETKLAPENSQSEETYYTVTFRTPLTGGIDSLTFRVVSLAGTNTPKVDTAFFLDLLQAPVKKLNQNLSPEPLTFQAIIEPSAYCFDDIPNSEAMARLIFFRTMDPKASPLTTAYLPQSSPIFQNLKNNDTPGVRISGTVAVKWNKTLDPQKPFLEVIDLKSSGLK